MKKINLISIFLFFIVTIIQAGYYITPRYDKVFLYKTATSKKMLKDKYIEFGKIYEVTKEKNNRYYIKDLGLWVDKIMVVGDFSKKLVKYKISYLKQYREEKMKEKKRVENEVKKHPEWPEYIKKAVLNFEIWPNWPESLVVASWGKPDTIIKTKYNDTLFTYMRYGNQVLILKNNKLKLIKYDPSREDKSIQIMIK